APAAVRVREVAALGATPAELAAAGNMLAASAVDALLAAGTLTATSSQAGWLLSLTWPGAVQVARRVFLLGNVLGWLADELRPLWADPAGTRTLADMLKVLPADRLEHVRAELAIAGLEIEDADGDDPDPD